MKKKILALAFAAVMMTGVVGCGKTDKSASGSIKAGMVTDSGTIDDKSFNQGTWEGLQQAKKDLGADVKYIQPNGETDADYMKEITNLYDAGYKFIVTPGFKFEGAIYDAQEKYQDAKFVLIDAVPSKTTKGADGKDVTDTKTASNTVSVSFAEHESGFVAGVAAALQLKEGDLGFVGGIEIPPVQRFNWGFQQGVAYANANLGTKMTIKAENVVYQGTFKDAAAGKQIAATMFDKGVKAIFAAAGGTGSGVINEAKERASAGKAVWAIGVDSDQYKDGVYSEGKSVVLTSAIKKVNTATYDLVKEAKEGKFEGGKALVFDAKNDGVGLPETNPNLSEETTKKVNEVYAKLKAGEIKVSGEQGSLIK